MTIQDLIARYRPGFVLERAMIADLEAFRDAEIARFCRERGLETGRRSAKMRVAGWLKRIICQHPPSARVLLHTYHADQHGPVQVYGCVECGAHTTEILTLR